MGWISSAVSEVPAETAEGARANDVALISGQTVGAKTANLFSGFVDPGLTIALNGSTKFANRTDYTYSVSDGSILRSTQLRMDVEMSGYLQGNTFLLRSANGKALYLTIGNTVEMGWIVSGFDPLQKTSPTVSGKYAAILTTPQAGLPGWTNNAATDVWTFGAVGFDVYAKYNGVEVLRYKDYAVMQAGEAIVFGGQYSGGTSDVTLRYLPASGLYSNRAKGIVDIRDWGASQFKTTGSIAASSNQLTVADASGFAVGNRLIIPVSFEAGLGLPGTMGVGASWPYLSYSDTTAMNAAGVPASGLYCWDRSSGYVYISNGTIWQKNDITTDFTSPDYQSRGDGGYYTGKAVPRALVATITDKSGNVLTLDKTASASVSGADVIFDCYPAFFPVTSDGGGYNAPIASNYSVRVPNGRWALGKPVKTTSNLTVQGVTVRGESKAAVLWAPRGAPNIGLTINNGQDCTIRTLSIEGNHKKNSADNDRPIYYWVPVNSDDTFNPAWDDTVSLTSCNRSFIKDIDNTDIMAFSARIFASNYCATNGVTLTMNARIMSYTQWYHTIVNGSECTIDNTQVLYSRGLIKAFEFFVSANPKIRNCGGYNALCSTNNSYNWLYDGFYSDIYGDSFNYINAGYWGEAVININNNSYHSSSAGGLMKNPRVVQHGYCTLNNDTVLFLQVAPDVTNVVITGQYDSDTTPFVAGKGGYFEAPDYGVIDPNKKVRSVISASVGRGVIIEAPGTVVTGLRVVGAAKSGEPNFWATSQSTGSTITGNIADVFNYGATITKSGNRTNAGVSVP